MYYNIQWTGISITVLKLLCTIIIIIHHDDEIEVESMT